jgi:glycosyltransferase involved in cell wall biosynthesis
MKVAMLTTTGKRCGIAAYSSGLVKALREFVKVEVEPIEEGKQTAEYHRAQTDRLNRADVVHVQHEYSFWGSFLPKDSSFWILRDMIKKPLVITAHMTLSFAEMLKVKECRNPLYRIYLESLLLRPGVRKSVEIAPFVTANECIVHTDAGRRILIGRGADPKRIHMVPAGVSEPFPLSAGGASIRERFGLSGKRILTIFGFISPNKGYELTLQILPELPPEVVLVIAGGPRTLANKPYVRKLDELIREMGLKDRVVITGYLTEENVADMMIASEIVLVPHTSATGSYSVTIPLAHGRPVIASDQDCFREIRDRLPCLQLFRSGDAAHFASCLKELLHNPAGMQEIGKRARLYAEKHSWREVARRTVDIYRKALGGGH